jgi:hypothetical protein
MDRKSATEMLERERADLQARAEAIRQVLVALDDPPEEWWPHPRERMRLEGDEAVRWVKLGAPAAYTDEPMYSFHLLAWEDDEVTIETHGVIINLTACIREEAEGSLHYVEELEDRRQMVAGLQRAVDVLAKSCETTAELLPGG